MKKTVVLNRNELLETLEQAFTMSQYAEPQVIQIVQYESDEHWSVANVGESHMLPKQVSDNDKVILTYPARISYVLTSGELSKTFDKALTKWRSKKRQDDFNKIAKVLYENYHVQWTR
jgi:hypothetical protein